MPHPVIHAEIRSADPDATRQFYADLFGWKVAAEGAFPGYTFIDTGVEGGTYVAISPRQSADDEVLFFVGVEDVAETLAAKPSSWAGRSCSRPSRCRARASASSPTPRATRSGSRRTGSAMWGPGSRNWSVPDQSEMVGHDGEGNADMSSAETWSLIHAEREAMVETLSSLSAVQWASPSWCKGWTVQDTAAHIVAAAEQTPLNFYKELIQAGFRFHVFTDRAAKRLFLGRPRRAGAPLCGRGLRPPITRRRRSWRCWARSSSTERTSDDRSA